MPRILHVVLARWRPDAEDPVARATAALDAHLPDIDGIVSVDAGPSVSTEGLERGNDWMLAIRFVDRAALDAYLPHPAHRPIAALLGAMAEQVTVFDIESPDPARQPGPHEGRAQDRPVGSSHSL